MIRIIIIITILQLFFFLSHSLYFALFICLYNTHFLSFSYLPLSHLSLSVPSLPPLFYFSHCIPPTSFLLLFFIHFLSLSPYSFYSLTLSIPLLFLFPYSFSSLTLSLPLLFFFPYSSLPLPHPPSISHSLHNSSITLMHNSH